MSPELLNSRPTSPVLACRSCGEACEAPYLFCQHCGALGSKLNRWLITANVSLALGAFFSAYYFAELLGWAWPIFALYAILFVQFGLWIGGISRAKAMRQLLWYLVFIGGLGACFHLSLTEGPLLIIFFLQDIPQMLAENAGITWPCLAALVVVVAVPLYGRWTREYGWFNAYRIVLLALFTLCLALLVLGEILEYAHLRGLIGGGASEPVANFIEKTKPVYARHLALAGGTIIRVLLVEIFVFAAVKGYARAHHARKPAAKPASSGFGASLDALANLAGRIALAIENMVRQLFSTAVEVSRAMARVAEAFLRELLAPAAALIIAAFVLLNLTFASVQYIARPGFHHVVNMMLSLGVVSLCAIIVAGTKTGARWNRIFSFYAQLVGWLTPNLLLFFIVISGSLIATSWLVNNGNTETLLPFALGPLTIAATLLLGLLVAVALLKRRNAVPQAEEPTPAIAPVASPPVIVSEEKAPEPIPTEEPIVDETKESDDETPHQQAPARAPRKPIFATRIFRNVLENPKAVELQQVLAGKPIILIRLREAETRLEEKRAQLERLYAGRETFSHHTFAAMEHKLTDEIADLEKRVVEMTKTVEEHLAEREREHVALTVRLEQTRTYLKDLDDLLAHGVIDEDEYDRRKSSTRAEIEFVSKQLDECEKQLSFLATP